MQGTGRPVKLSELLLTFWHMGYKMNHPPDSPKKAKADTAESEGGPKSSNCG